MNGITHKQAIKLIHRRQDGLLMGHEQSLLDEHLLFCSSCRTYSDEMVLLGTRLNHEFQARWDEDPGPSKKVVENVNAKAKDIPAAKRASSGLRLVGGLTVLVILGVVINFLVLQLKNSSPVANGTQSVGSFPVAEERLLAFASNQSGNQDIYTMRADGSQLTDITNDPANDYSPLWSPDGKRIVFISERTGNADIFVMYLDGSNLAQLTDNPGYDGFFKLSPDGSKIIYTAGQEDVNQDVQLVLMDIDGGNKAILTGPGSYLFLGWSPDGKKIVYLEQNTETNNPQDDIVVVMNTDGTDRHEWNFIVDRIKWEDNQHFIGDGWNGQVESPDWAWVLHRFSTSGEPPVEIASHSNRIAEILKDTHVVGGGSILAWYTSDGSAAPFTSWNSIDVCRGVGDRFIPTAWTSTAPDESKTMIVIPCQSGTTWFYVNPLDGSEIRKLTDFFLDGVKGGVDWSWSPDGKYGIMTISSPDNGQENDLYLFNIEQMLKEPSVQPIRIISDKATINGVVWQPAP